MERVKKSRFQFDSQSVRPYFAYRKVIDGVLATTESLYGVEVRRNETEPVWHESVECYDVFEGGEPRRASTSTCSRARASSSTRRCSTSSAACAVRRCPGGARLQLPRAQGR